MQGAFEADNAALLTSKISFNDAVAVNSKGKNEAMPNRSMLFHEFIGTKVLSAGELFPSLI